MSGVLLYFCVIIVKFEQASESLNFGGRGGSRTAATSKLKHFVIIDNGCKLLTIITKSSILHVAAVLDPRLGRIVTERCFRNA